MITWKTIKVKKDIVVSVTCDVCKTEYKEDDIVEQQEFHHINFTGGYGSVFGDGSNVRADICQKCLYKMIGDICSYSDGYGNEEY